MNQLQALRLGFNGYNSLARVVTGNLSIGPVVSLGIRSSSMGSKRNVSGLSKPVPIMAEDSDLKGKKLKALVCTKPNPDQEKCLIKENGVELCSVEIESYKDDPERIEKMTIQELRTTLRSIGLPAKGRKIDLISALKLFMEKNINGESSPVVEEQALSISTKSVSMEPEAENCNDEDGVNNVRVVSEVRERKRSKRTVKKSGNEGNADQLDDIKMIATKQKLLVKSAEVSGEKCSKTKKSVSSRTIVFGIDSKVGMPVMETEPWTVLAHMKPQKHWVPYNPRTMRPPPLSSGTKSIKLMSWNANGLRALLKLEGFSALELTQREDFDVLCLQETKQREKDVESIACMIDGYHNNFWTCSSAKLGYSGTAIISRVKPLSVKYGIGISDHDSERRLVTAEFDSFYLICAYVPNSVDALIRLTYWTADWDQSLSIYMKIGRDLRLFSSIQIDVFGN